MTPVDVLRQWFAAHADGDLERAGALMADGAPIQTADGDTLHGFDALMKWYAGRRDAEGPSFRYDVLDLLGGTDHAAAVIRLSTADRQWRQIAVYRIAHGVITAMAMYEDPS